MRYVSALVGALLVLMLLPVGAAAAELGDEPATALPARIGVKSGNSSNMSWTAAHDPASWGEFEDVSNTMWF
jgi:hypothetical protein